MTACSEIIERFYRYIENDADFFEYFDLDENQCMVVAHQRSSILLIEAASYLSNKIGVGSVFNVDPTLENITEDLTAIEIDLLVKAMFLCYLKRELRMTEKINRVYIRDTKEIFYFSFAGDFFEKNEEICPRCSAAIDSPPSAMVQYRQNQISEKRKIP